MRNKYGIIEVDLGEVIIENAFGDDENNDITSQISESAKNVILSLKELTKLVYIKGKITDVDENSMTYNGLYGINSFVNVYGFNLSFVDVGSNVEKQVYLTTNGTEVFIYS